MPHQLYDLMADLLHFLPMIPGVSALVYSYRHYNSEGLSHVKVTVMLIVSWRVTKVTLRKFPCTTWHHIITNDFFAKVLVSDVCRAD